jgi:hypothetical protein
MYSTKKRRIKEGSGVNYGTRNFTLRTRHEILVILARRYQENYNEPEVYDA